MGKGACMEIERITGGLKTRLIRKRIDIDYLNPRQQRKWLINLEWRILICFEFIYIWY